jgi:hypothetical protein
MIAVETSPITTLTPTTTTSMMFIGSRSCCSATAHPDGGFSLAMRLGPYRLSRAAASPRPSPCSASLSSAATASVAGWANHGCPSVASGRRCSIVPVPSVIGSPQGPAR